MRYSALEHPQRLIALLGVLSRLIPWILLHLLSSLPPFDSSAQILSGEPGSATLRWDAVHFTGIAKDGYQFEQQIAFQPGWPLLLRLLSFLPATSFGGAEEYGRIARVGEVLACGSYTGAAVMLYRLTALIFPPSFALMTSMLYLLPPAPAVLSSAFSEPIFALLTFTGFYYAIQRRFLVASLFLAGSTSVRATGILAIGPVGWIMILGDEALASALRKPGLLLRRCASGTMPILIIILPFALSQAYFYHTLCYGSTSESWCESNLPMAYSYVQKKYWNIGFINYWTLAQLPNSFLALPVLLVSFLGAYRYFHSWIRIDQSKPVVTKPAAQISPSIFGLPHIAPTSTRILLPFYIHSLALTLLLLFSAHTQIALRVCVTDPVIWWSLAGLSFNWRATTKSITAAGESVSAEHGTKKGAGAMTPVGRVWVWWTVVYGAISIVLWAGHYPPA